MLRIEPSSEHLEKRAAGTEPLLSGLKWIALGKAPEGYVTFRYNNIVLHSQELVPSGVREKFCRLINWIRYKLLNPGLRQWNRVNRLGTVV